MANHRSICSRTFSRLPARAAIGVTIAAAALAGPTAANAATATPTTATATHAAALSTVPHAAAPKQARTPDKERSEKVTVTAAQVLALAKAQLGTSEDENGGGTKYQVWYMNTPRAEETVKRDGGSRQEYLDAAWCSMFVSWVGDHSGAGASIGRDAYTVEHARWFKNNDRWGDTAKPGAVVFFSWSGGKSLDDIEHVGFVEKDNHDGTISTIEGNTSGKVAERVRSKSDVVGYGYPDYAA
jgi:cell wall-associated NlpC family hydrolase